MKPGDEFLNIKELSEEIAAQQAFEVAIKSDRSKYSRTMRKYLGLPSLYSDPEKLDRMIDELEAVLAGYLKQSHSSGRILGQKKLNEFLEASERAERSSREIARIRKLTDRQAAKRLEIAFDELEKEAGILKADIKIYKKNAKLAGFTDKEILTQLSTAGRNKEGFAAGFEKRSKSVAAAAVRREEQQSELDQFRAEFSDSANFQWIAISVNPCPDCRARAGVIMTLREWMTLGIPGSGRTICGRYCLCKLIPEQIADKMFPTVKEFRWSVESAVLLTPAEARKLKRKSSRS